MGIGPELPPHLARPRRSPSPPPPRPGPSPSSSARVSTAAPTAQAGAGGAEDYSDDDFGPALPPDLAQERKARGPVAGPQLPPSAAAENPSPAQQAPLSPHISAALRPERGGQVDDDDDDDAVGPMPLPAGYSAAMGQDNDGARAFKEREERLREKERKDKEDKKVKREEWMLVPPKEMDLLSSIDTTKLKSRGFATGKAAQSAANKSGPSNLWTETPAERQQRLEDEALGRKRRAENAPVEEEGDDDRRKRIRDQQLKAEVERHNTSKRNESLVDQHTRDRKAKPKGDDDRAPTNIWDRDRDMGVSGRLMDDGQRSNIIKNAKGLGGRFSGGGFM